VDEVIELEPEEEGDGYFMKSFRRKFK